jgi:hypothetical protein
MVARQPEGRCLESSECIGQRMGTGYARGDFFRPLQDSTGGASLHHRGFAGSSSSMWESHVQNLHDLPSGRNPLQCVHRGPLTIDRGDRTTPFNTVETHICSDYPSVCTAQTTYPNNCHVDCTRGRDLFCGLWPGKVGDTGEQEPNGRGDGDNISRPHNNWLGSLVGRVKRGFRVFQLRRISPLSGSIPVGESRLVVADPGRQRDGCDERHTPDVSKLPDNLPRVQTRVQHRPQGPLRPESFDGKRHQVAIQEDPTRALFKVSDETGTSHNRTATATAESASPGRLANAGEEKTREEFSDGGCEGGESEDEVDEATSEITYEEAVRSRLAEVGWKLDEDPVAWESFIKRGEHFFLWPRPCDDPVAFEVFIKRNHNIDPWAYLEEHFDFEVDDLEVVLGSYEWYFLVSTDPTDPCIYGMETDNLDVYICGTTWQMADETVDTFWNYSFNLQPLIIATPENRQRYLNGWKPSPKVGYVDGVSVDREYR